MDCLLAYTYGLTFHISSSFQIQLLFLDTLFDHVTAIIYFTSPHSTCIVGFSFVTCHMAAASGRNCTQCVGRLIRTLNTTARSSTRSLFQSVPTTTRFVVTRSFVSAVSLAASVDVTAVNVTPLLVHIGGDATITDMEDDEGNGRAKHRRWALFLCS